MTGSSNIDAVIERTRRLPQRINAAMALASAPMSWLDEARDVARRTVEALATPEQGPQASAFVATVTASLLGGDRTGFAIAMHAPGEPLRTALQDARTGYAVSTPIERAQGLFAASIGNMESLILEWVSTPEDEGGKRRDARDWGKSDEEIAGLIAYIMLSPNLGPKGQAAREGLQPHIEAFIRQKLDAQHGVTPQTSDLWLRAVLTAWRAWVGPRWLERVRQNLKS